MTTRFHFNKYAWMIMSTMLVLAIGSLTARAQDNGTSGGSTPSAAPAPSTSTPSTSTAPSSSGGGSAVEQSSSHSSSTTTETQGPQNIDSNTWLLIGIAVIAFLVLIIVIARAASSKRTVSSRTTILK